ncbi:hypothetical protein NBRGN_065_00360 [Nocardia brasiliensis NBRC 14402]|uniref:DUF6932 family protein n=1 Tax=Nocardia brasiliensis TaxID=37326 RepID=UPI00045D3709|nr:hypothetical protein [Nocardia brasiliensis]GAJ83640.1 hypothetical protein NBRGN_065_00360 [Nocardia brasiliensis NBRC 14402]
MVLPDLVAGAEGYSVLPPGRWTCTRDEFRQQFVNNLPDSTRRKQLTEDLDEYRRQQQACGLVVMSYWIDGSFATAKLNPGDIDITAIVDGSASQFTPAARDWLNPGPRWKSLAHPNVGRTLLVDGYSVVKLPDQHPEAWVYHMLRGKWDDFWQRCRATGEATSKGYVEVMPWWT